MPIKVLHVIGQIGIGGAEMQLLELCRRMDRSKFQMAVCYYAHASDNLEQAFRDAGIELRFTDKFRVPLWRFFGHLRRIIRDWKPDILHAWQQSPIRWGRLAGRLAGCRHFVAAERTGNPKYDRFSRLVEILLGHRTIWIANSRAVADVVAREMNVPREQIRVIYNGIELPPRDRATDRADVRRELGLAPEQPIVLTAGRLTAAKNYPMFLRTAKRVSDRRPDVCFVAAGHGPEEEMLTQRHCDLGLGEQVRMLGLRRDVPRLLAAADLFCLCSLWEGFPNALAEAMCSGLPVVSTRFAGAEEVVVENETGLLVPLDDDAAMAERLLELLQDSALRQRLAQSAQTFVRTTLSWERVLAAITDQYESLLASTGSPAAPTG